MQETQVRSLGWKDPLEEEMATQSSICSWRIPWNKEPGRLHSTGSQKSQTLLSEHSTSVNKIDQQNNSIIGMMPLPGLLNE